MKQAPLCVCMHGSSHMKSVGGRRNKREDEGACTPVRACLCAIVYCSMCVCACTRSDGEAERVGDRK